MSADRDREGYPKAVVYEFGERTANIIAGLFASHGKSYHETTLRPNERIPYEQSITFKIGQKMADAAVNSTGGVARVRLDNFKEAVYFLSAVSSLCEFAPHRNEIANDLFNAAANPKLAA